MKPMTAMTAAYGAGNHTLLAYVPYRIEFPTEHVQRYRGHINRHDRRRYNKLARLGRLFSDMVPMWYLAHSEQVKF
jgi:hypothetical protein